MSQTRTCGEGLPRVSVGVSGEAKDNGVLSGPLRDEALAGVTSADRGAEDPVETPDAVSEDGPSRCPVCSAVLVGPAVARGFCSLAHRTEFENPGRRAARRARRRRARRAAGEAAGRQYRYHVKTPVEAEAEARKERKRRRQRESDRERSRRRLDKVRAELPRVLGPARTPEVARRVLAAEAERKPPEVFSKDVLAEAVMHYRRRRAELQRKQRRT